MKNHYFFAVSLPSHVKETLLKWRNHYENQLPFRTWVYKEDYHITLAFLGDVDASSLPSLRKAMRVIDASRFSISLQGIHSFGKPENPRILWAGVTSCNELISLHQQVNTACEHLGFSLDKRPFQPHITLAKRYKSEQPFHKKLVIDSITFSVESFSLFVTHLDTLPKYEEIDTFPLT